MKSEGRRLWWLTAGAICFGLALFSLRPVIETDVFYQLRAGADIIKHFHYYIVDEWSYTAKGLPVYNYQGLSDAFLRLVYDGGGFAALSWLRASTFALWLLLVVALIARLVQSDRSRWFLLVLLVPWVFFMDAIRFQLRPDAFMAVLFLGFVHLWLTPMSLRRYGVISVSMLVLWANMHAGTAPIGIIAALLFLLLGRPQDRFVSKVPWAIASILTIFATPLGFEILSAFRTLLFEYDSRVNGNVDYQPFSWRLLDWHYGTWSALWIPYLLLWSGSSIWWWRNGKLKRSELNRLAIPAAFLIFIGLGLSLGSFSRIRLLYYAIACMLPIVIFAIDIALQKYSHRVREFRILTRALIVLWSVLFVLHLAIPSLAMIHPGLSDINMPVQTAEFIREHNPKPRVFNPYNFGGYLILEIPDYEVSFDTREMQYIGVRRELSKLINNLGDSEKAYSEFFSRFGVNMVLRSHAQTYRSRAQDVVMIADIPLNIREWALVSVDNSSELFLRRIPENAELIAKYEYRHLRFGLPFAKIATSKTVEPKLKAALEEEIDRCLREGTRVNVDCSNGKAQMELARGNLAAAEEHLRASVRENPYDAESLRELAGVLDRENHEALAFWYRLRWTLSQSD